MFKISFIIVAYNAGRHLDNIFSDLEAQSFDHQDIEIILVDSGSTDDTKPKMEQFAARSDFSRAIVLDNPGKTLPHGWNVALKECHGDIIVRLDAHSRIDSDFLDCVAKNMDSGEKIVGGQRISIFDKDSLWQNILAHAERSMFGSGIADYRRNVKRSYVKTLAHAAYSREVFDAAGPYDERLARTEDNDMHYRMRMLGYRFCMCPDIVSFHFVRSSLKTMMKQKFSNGYWVGLTSGIQPRCLSLYHFVPFLFVLGMLGTAVLSLILGSILPFAILMGAYFLAAVLAMIKEMLGEKKLYVTAALLLLPILFFLLHTVYGVGTFIGILRFPFWNRKHKRQ